MQNIYEILARAAALRDETQLNSISPERAGGIMYDTLLALNDLWLQQGAALVISKIYASVAAMEADTAPVSDLTGQPLRPGQIVVIASEDSDNGSVYRYNGTESPSWSLVGEIGNLEPVDSLDSDSTQLPLAAHQGKVLDEKISQLGQYVENPEWVRVVTDNDGKILYGVKTDGKFYFGDGCPPQVQEYVQAQIDAIGIDALLATKVDKVTGKSLIDAGVASSFKVIENSKYIEVKTDSDSKILESITPDGRKQINIPVDMPALTIEKFDSAEWLQVTTDNEEKIISGIKADGTKVEYTDTSYPNGIPSEIKEYIDEKVSPAYPALRNKTIVCFGDSITMFTGTDGKNYPTWMDDLSEATVIGCGFGGSRVSSRTNQTLTPSNLTQANAPFDLVNLVTSICGNDYSYLDAGLQYIIDYDSEWISTQFRDTLNRIKAIDWSKVDYVTILIGSNDWTASASPGASGSSDVTTVLGAINKVIETLLLTYPHLKIFWFTPLLRCIVPDFNANTNYSVDDVCYYSTNRKYYKFINAHQGAWDDNDVEEISVYEARKPEWYSDVLTINGITLKELAKDILDEVTLNHIPVDDIYNNLGWNRYNFTEYFLDIDATHPYKGFKYIAEKILGFLNSSN